MKPYLLIKGTDQNIASFEQQVADALEQGYEFQSDLIITSIPQTHGAAQIVLMQPMIFEDEEADFDDIDFEEDEEEIVVRER